MCVYMSVYVYACESVCKFKKNAAVQPPTSHLTIHSI